MAFPLGRLGTGDRLKVLSNAEGEGTKGRVNHLSVSKKDKSLDHSAATFKLLHRVSQGTRGKNLAHAKPQRTQRICYKFLPLEGGG